MCRGVAPRSQSAGGIRLCPLPRTNRVETINGTAEPDFKGGKLPGLSLQPRLSQLEEIRRGVFRGCTELWVDAQSRQVRILLGRPQ